MKNKGFSLIELLAVILITSILMILATGMYIKLQGDVLDKQYENVVHNIENKAIDFAAQYGSTRPIDVTVEFLVQEGFYQPDDQDNVYDPRNNNIKLNCNVVHVVLVNGEYVATFGDAEENEDGTCKESAVNLEDVVILCNGIGCSDNWHGNDLVLSLGGIDDEEIRNATVEWTSLSGVYKLQKSGEDKNFTVDVNAVLNTTFNASIKTSDKTYNASVNLKIDKERPVLIKTSLDINYTGTQKLVVDASDMNGAGLTGYAITKGNCDSASYKKGNINVTQAGKFNLCIKDNVGNVTSNEININKIRFNYNNLSSPSIKVQDVFYLENSESEPLLIPTRNGYEFSYWVDSRGNRVHDFSQLKNGDEIKAEWELIDLDINVDKIDRNSIGVVIPNRVNMILVLDESGSMKNGTSSSLLKSAVSNTISSINFEIGSTVSIVEFTTLIKRELVACRNQFLAQAFISGYDPQWGDDENFALALDRSFQIIHSNNFERDKTFVIFFTDGNDVASTSQARQAAAARIRNSVKDVYAIGLNMDESWKWKVYEVITSTANYFDSNGMDLSDIFFKIAEEIREEVPVRSQHGKIALPQLYVSSENPFVLNVRGYEYSFSSIYSIIDMLDYEAGSYYLNLAKVDNKYKLDGNLRNVSFTYYYDGVGYR